MKHIKTQEIAYCGLFSALIAMGAWIQIPLPNHDYITMQFFFVQMAGFLLGSRLGAMSVALYILIGLCGIPVFAGGGGPAYVLRPSFGFLLGFILNAYCTGKALECRKENNMKTYMMAVCVGFFITYALGIIYKYVMMRFYMGTEIPFTLLILACLPVEIPKDFVFSILAASVARRYQSLKIQHFRFQPKS